MCFLMLGQFTVIPFISPYMVSNVHFTEGQLTYIYLIGGLFTIFTSPAIGKLSDRYGKHYIFKAFILISLIPIVAITNMPSIEYVPLWLVLVATTLFFIAVGGRMIPAMALITSTVHPRNRGSFMSINSSVQQLSAGLAAFISGAVITKVPDSAELKYYPVIGVIAICASLACIFIAKKVTAIPD
jgi:predicted MFS family arabinose efflux permease